MHSNPYGSQPRFLYLHGFASSPSSRKAQFFASRLRAEGVTIEIPAMDEGDFARLTLTAQLEVVRRCAGNEPLVLVGSSMGGYLASLYAARHANVLRMILLAPAFRFAQLWRQSLGEQGLERWRKEGSMQVFHYGFGREVQLDCRLMDDAEQYEAEPEFVAPALIFHGNQDKVVSVESSVQFARKHPHVELVRLEAGHELTEVLEPIWQLSKPFLQSVLAGI